MAPHAATFSLLYVNLLTSAYAPAPYHPSPYSATTNVDGLWAAFRERSKQKGARVPRATVMWSPGP